MSRLMRQLHGRQAPGGVYSPGPEGRRRFRQTMVLVAIVFVVVGFYTLKGSSYSIFVVDTILLAAIGAVALDLLMGTGGQVSIGNAAFLAAGAYATVWAIRAGVPFPFDIFIAGCACAVAGLIVGLPALRIRGMYLALATLAAFYIAEFVGRKYQSRTVGAAGFSLKETFTGTLSQRHASWAWLLAGVLSATIIVASWLRSGRSGRAWRMIRDHEVAASMMGIPVARYKLMLFVLTSAIIGVEGGLLARFTNSVTSDTYTLNASISVIAMILIGGLDSQAGPLIGAVIVSMLPIVVPNVVHAFASSSSVSNNASAFSEIIYGALIMIFIVAAPQGINGLLHMMGRRYLSLVRTLWSGRLRGAPATTISAPVATTESETAAGSRQ